MFMTWAPWFMSFTLDVFVLVQVLITCLSVVMARGWRWQMVTRQVTRVDTWLNTSIAWFLYLPTAVMFMLPLNASWWWYLRVAMFLTSVFLLTWQPYMCDWTTCVLELTLIAFLRRSRSSRKGAKLLEISIRDYVLVEDLRDLVVETLVGATHSSRGTGAAPSKRKHNDPRSNTKSVVSLADS